MTHKTGKAANWINFRVVCDFHISRVTLFSFPYFYCDYFAIRCECNFACSHGEMTHLYYPQNDLLNLY